MSISAVLTKTLPIKINNSMNEQSVKHHTLTLDISIENDRICRTRTLTRSSRSTYSTYSTYYDECIERDESNREEILVVSSMPMKIPI